MSDDVQEPDDDDEPVAIAPKDLKALRAIAKDFGDLKQQAEAAQRELAFARAKLDLTDPKMGYFIKGYEGDLEPEKIREAAIQAGFLNQEQKKVAISSGELSGHQQMTDAAAGGQQGSEDLAELIRNAQSQEEVMALMTKHGYPTSWSSQ